MIRNKKIQEDLDRILNEHKDLTINDLIQNIRDLPGNYPYTLKQILQYIDLHWT
jgi:hypothetical protein